jgi:osmotically inducible protein OsmC
MAIRTAAAAWQGDLKAGKGQVKLGSGVYEGPYTYASRFEDGKGTNPEELIGAAHAACYSMFLSAILSKDGFVPTRVSTQARVHLDESPKVTLIELEVEAVVPGIKQDSFLTYAETAKKGCPISVALSAVEIKLQARLVE